MDGCHRYDAAKKTIKSIIQMNGMPKANMFVETRAMISAFDLNSVLSESGTISTRAAAKMGGSTPNKARYPVIKPSPDMFVIATLCFSRKALIWRAAPINRARVISYVCVQP